MHNDELILALTYHVRQLLSVVNRTINPVDCDTQTLFDVFDAHNMLARVKELSEYSAT